MKKFLCLLLIIILIQTFGFTSICDEEGLVGDLNEDGIVNSIDATILKDFYWRLLIIYLLKIFYGVQIQMEMG